jgi:hypothetical protein
MSTGKSEISHINGFIERFVEVCGTDKPREIQQLLNISYQAARNYLTGRLPDTATLLRIASATPYSVHWLLTGRGKKFVEIPTVEDTPLSPRQFSELVRKVKVEVINEIGERREASPTPTASHSRDRNSD